MNVLCLLGMHIRCREQTVKRGRNYQSICVRCDRLMVREVDGRWRALKVLRIEKARLHADQPKPRSTLWRGSPDGSVELEPLPARAKRKRS